MFQNSAEIVKKLGPRLRGGMTREHATYCRSRVNLVMFRLSATLASCTSTCSLAWKGGQAAAGVIIGALRRAYFVARLPDLNFRQLMIT